MIFCSAAKWPSVLLKTLRNMPRYEKKTFFPHQNDPDLFIDFSRIDPFFPQRVSMKDKIALALNDVLETGTEWLTKNTVETLVPSDIIALMQPFIHLCDEARDKMKLKSDEVALLVIDKFVNYILRSFEPHRSQRRTRLMDPNEFRKTVGWLKLALNLIIV